jgi:hypothetical protein
MIFAALALSACGSKNAADNSAVGEENAASQTIVTNDVTAIDAATGEAANMAPDVNYTFDESNLENGTNTSNTTATTSNSAATHRPARKAAKPAAADANSVESAPANSAQ